MKSLIGGKPYVSSKEESKQEKRRLQFGLSINHAEKILKYVRLKTNCILVSFSGGKDSIVTLDLCYKLFPKVVCFFLYIIPNLEIIDTKIDEIEKRYRIKVLQYPHPDLAKSLYRGDYTFHLHSDLKLIKFKDIYENIRMDTGIQWIASGVKASDSMVRNAWMKSLYMQGISEQSKLVYPITKLNKNDVLTYCTNLEIEPLKYNNKASSGLEINKETIQFLHANYPNDYKRLKQYFKFADLALL